MKLSGRRIVAMALLVIFILTGFSVRLARYQIVEGADYREQSQKVTIQSSEIEAPRGEILDRYGRVLASNKVGYSIYLQKAFFPSTKQPVKQNNVINSICKILSQKGESWNDSLPISKTAPYCFNAKNTSDLKKLRSLLNVSDKVGASDIMKKLVSRYHLEGNSSADQRTLAGIRYEMEIRDFTYSNPYEFASSVSIDTVTKIKERSTSLPGVEIREVPTRVYPDGTIAPHVIGTVGPIYAEQYAALKKKGYSMNDTVGKDGIEYTMESYLRGTKGEQTIEMDSMGNVTSTNITTKANPGDNVVLTIDSDLQKLVQSSLQSTIQNIASTAKSVKWGSQAKSGAAVVLDIKTGEVLAMANYPSYDLNTYKKDYSALSNDSANPLLNRCVTGSYRPGSTFKPITAISGLVNGAIQQGEVIHCPAYFTKYSPSYVGSDDEGIPRTVDVTDALSQSSNIFFNIVGDRLGITKLANTAKIFGIGQKTGIELPGETSGVMSSPAEKAARDAGSWNPGDTVQASIGQFDTMISPLQLASYVATLCNYGTRYQVHIVKSVKTYDNSKTVLDNSTPKVVSKTDLPQSLVDTVKEGMRKVVEEGTADTVFQNYQIKIGGKTGTAEVSQGYNGVFIAFAPYDNPRYAVAVVVEHGHNGYQTAPVAKAAFNYFFRLSGSGGSVLPTSQTTVGSLIQ